MYQRQSGEGNCSSIAGEKDMDGCSAGIDIASDSLEHSVHGDGSFDEAAGVYRLYARCRQA